VSAVGIYSHKSAICPKKQFQCSIFLHFYGKKLNMERDFKPIRETCKFEFGRQSEGKHFLENYKAIRSFMRI
jgi:hypothetical protein